MTPGRTGYTVERLGSILYTTGGDSASELN